MCATYYRAVALLGKSCDFSKLTVVYFAHKILHTPIHVDFTYPSHVPLRNYGEIVLCCFNPQQPVKLIKLWVDKHSPRGRVIITILENLKFNRGGISVKIIKSKENNTMKKVLFGVRRLDCSENKASSSTDTDKLVLRVDFFIIPKL